MNIHNTNFPHLAPRLNTLPRNYSTVPLSETAREEIIAKEVEQRRFETSVFDAAQNLTNSGMGGNYQVDPSQPDTLQVTPTGKPEELSTGVQITPKDSDRFTVDFAIHFRTPKGTQVQSRKSGTEEWILRTGLEDVPKPYLDAVLGVDRQLRDTHTSRVAEKGKGFIRRLTRR